MRHELVKLADLIDWEFFEREWAGCFPSTTGRPATPPRLVAGLMYMQHAYRLSDVAVIARWVDSPYVQHFTGETFFQHTPPIHPSSLSRWRDRIGEEGGEWLLTKTIQAGRSGGVIDDGSLARLSVDTTVMEKNIAHPTDAWLYEKARVKLVALAKDLGLDLRQTYARKAPRLAMQISRYPHARQFKRMRKALRTLRGYVGCVMRDIRRRLAEIPAGVMRVGVAEMLARVSKLLHQAQKGKGKIYALHEPDVDCISKGKARVRYEFGCNVSLATTIDKGFVVGMRAMPGNPYDGHTLAEALEQVETLTDSRPDLAVVDRGYRGHGVGTTQLISGMRRGLTNGLKAQLRRRSVIEPEIGHMKTDGRLARCPLKGFRGDALFAVLCGCGHNIRKILARLRAFLVLLFVCLSRARRATNSFTDRSIAMQIAA